VDKKDLSKAALEYHSGSRPGKIEVVSTKPCRTQRDLSLAYTPGVAQPCIEISKDPENAYKYTSKGNLVAVISNGTAVLGLGNLGPLASKPVMEGKGILFKRFADIDVFDIEIKTEDPEEFIRCVELLEPTFGGINLEDIKAPECFIIEERLKKTMNIPVFHDDQHGTAIISGAAFLNGCELKEMKPSELKIVFSGGGAAAIACAKLYISLGAKPENIIMCDSNGVIYKGREKGMNIYKEAFAIKDNGLRTLEDAINGADAFVGLSVAGALTPKMVKSLGKRALLFAMANPDPEIGYFEAKKLRSDLIIATGRSDYPNQVNNVLGFPFIFRGALDVRASTINEAMKVAAVHALAKLAREDVTDSVSKAYDGQRFRFGDEYIIPKPFDHRALLWVAPAVAQAAIESGVAKNKLDMNEYRSSLERRLGVRQSFVRSIKEKIGSEESEKALPRIVFPEGSQPKILRACDVIIQEGIAQPILLGNEKRIQASIEKLGLTSLSSVTIVTPSASDHRDRYAQEYWRLRQRKGVTREQAYSIMKNENYYGSMMVRIGDADGLLSGITQSYPDTIGPFLQVVGARKGMKIAGVYMMLFKDRTLFFADTTVNIEPTASDLADIAICCAEEARFFGIEPRVAMLSFSNFGSNLHHLATKVKEATRLVKLRRPDILVDGEMQADTAVVPELMEEGFPFCEIKGGANVLIFPDLQSANICYKLMQRLGGAEAIGPILVGMNKPINVLQRSADVEEIVNMARITVLEIQQSRTTAAFTPRTD